MLNHAHLKSAVLTEGQLKITISALSQGTFQLTSPTHEVNGMFDKLETVITVGVQGLVPNFNIKLITEASKEVNFMNIIGGVCCVLGTTLYLAETNETYFVYANKLYDQCTECVICTETAPEILLPCGHTCMCGKCADTYLCADEGVCKVCPICRAPIIEVFTEASS